MKSSKFFSVVAIDISMDVTLPGKSKGQFYTPAEVSRIMAKVIGIDKSKSQSESVYDPTCGSGSLLLKAANESPHGLSIYGQENDNATRALAVMNNGLYGYCSYYTNESNYIIVTARGSIGYTCYRN